MSDAADKILADLPGIQQIALRPLARNPLLPIVLEQAEALREIGGWAGAARAMVADGTSETVPEAPAEGTPEEPTPMRAAGRTRGG